MANGDNNSGNPYSQQDIQRSEQVTSLARSLTEELKDQLGIRSRLNETEKAQLNLARQVQRTAAENTVELGNQGSIARQIAKDQKLLLKIGNERKTLEKTTNNVQQDRAKRIFQVQSKIQQIQDQLLQSSGEEADNLQRQLNTSEGILRGILRTADADTQRLALAYGMEDVTKTVIDQREKEAEIQKEINDRMGVSGALVKGTGALMERLGMRSGIFNDAMKESQEVMQEMAEESTRIVETLDENGNIVKKTLADHSKTAIMLKGLSTLSKGFGKALFDPFTLATAIFSAFLDVNKAGVEFTRLTGQTSISLAKTVTEGSNLVDLMNTASELTKQTGLNAAAIFSPDQIGQLSDAKNLLGVSAEQAANLGMMMKLTGQSADQLGESIYENVDAGISQKMVYDDILSASDDIVASAGGNTAELGRAASAARKLGMDLAKVNQIADGLLDFESSISSELEAQLLTGKNINLAKARELALNNDLEGVAEELAKNGASAAEFAKMNRIQQQALAQALGMSREELGKMVLTEEALADMTAEQRAQARGVTLEQSKQMDLQEKISKLTSSFMEKFAPLLEAFLPIVDVLVSGLRGAMIILNPLIEGFKLITNVITTITGGISDATAQMVVMSAILSRVFYKSLATAITKIFGASASLGPLGLAAATAGAVSLASLATGYFKKGDDIVSSPGYGDRTLMGPEGAIQLNNKDTVIAGTNLFGGEGGAGGATVDTRALEAKLDRLIAAVTAGGNVYLDGNKVGEAQVLGTYKSS